MERIENKPKLQNCLNCPEIPGRSCLRYKGGEARLVFTPKETLSGRVYGQPFSMNESIDDCEIRIKAEAETKNKVG